MVKRSVVSLLLLVLALGATFASADAPIEGRAGRAEVRFMEGMIDHHQMALDMAAHCLERASTEAVVTLCEAVIAAQTPEIEQMQAWLAEWYNVEYAPVPMMDMDDAMGGMGGMHMEGEMHTDPPMMMGMFAGLNRYEGVEYEIAWLEAMIDHHDDAIHMSERLLARIAEGEGHAELRELAQNIITAQSAEIEQMETLITDLSDQ